MPAFAISTAVVAAAAVLTLMVYAQGYQLLRHPQSAVRLAQRDGSLAAQFPIEPEDLMLAAADEPASSPLQFARANHGDTGEKSAVHGCSDIVTSQAGKEKSLVHGASAGQFRLATQNSLCRIATKLISRFASSGFTR